MSEKALTACHDDDDDDDEDKKDEKDSVREWGREGTRLLHASNGDEDRAAAMKKTRRKRERWREGADGGNLRE